MGSAVLIVNRLGPEAAAYYREGPPGRWCGVGATELSLEGQIRPAELRAILAGRDPTTRTSLPEHRSPHRRAGWDLMLAAPKSMSLLAGLATEPVMATAHERAVDDTVDWLEGHACFTRRAGARVAATGLVAARFEHRVSSAGDPHVHTHLVVANLASAAGKWTALDGSALWLERRAIAAAYHLGLRHHVAEAGLDLPWQLAPDGTADVATVPRAAVEATSQRRVAIRAELEARPRRSHAGEVARVQLRTETHPDARRRADPSETGQRPEQQPALIAPPPPPPSTPYRWVGRSGAAGLGSAAADALLEEGRATAWTTRALTAGAIGPAEDEVRRLAGAVVVYLAERRSTFNTADVMSALAATHAPGATATEATHWAQQFCAAAVPSADGRWTTPYAQALDERFASLARAVEAKSHTVLPTAGSPDAARSLVTRPDGVIILGAAPVAEPWLGQAAVVGAAAEAWRAAGLEVTVTTASALSERRWDVLTGIGADGPQGQADVLVVDQADRMAAAPLARTIEEAAATRTKVVLVAGGTLPPLRRARSEGFESAAQDLGRITPAAGDHPAVVDRLLESWWNERPLLVGLGPAECRALNQAARRRLAEAGTIDGEDVRLGGTPFARGDQVLILRRQLGSAGMTGTVDAIDRRRGVAHIRWADGSRQPVDRFLGRHLGHAYATTPAMLRLSEGPVAVLGPALALGRHQGRVVASIDRGTVRQTNKGLERDAGREHAAGMNRRRGAELGW